MSNKLIVGCLLLLSSGIASAHLRDRDDCDGWKCRGNDTPVHAQAAPEVEIASAGAALALLAGGIIVLRGRKVVRKG